MKSLYNKLSLVVLLTVSAILLAGPASAELSVEEQAMVDWIDEHAEDSIDLLEELVNIGSGTMNPEGIHEVGEVLPRSP